MWQENSYPLLYLIKKIIQCPKTISYHILRFFQPFHSSWERIEFYCPRIWFSILNGAKLIPYLNNLERQLIKHFVSYERDMEKWFRILRNIGIQQQHPISFLFDLMNMVRCKSYCLCPIHEYTFSFFSICIYYCFQKHKIQIFWIFFILLKWSKEARHYEPFLFGDLLFPDQLLDFLSDLTPKFIKHNDQNLHVIITKFLYSVWLHPRSKLYFKANENLSKKLQLLKFS